VENNYVTYQGVIEFEPENKTKKHDEQSSWKRVAIVLMPGDICEYYAWFIKKRYDITLIKPLRKAHVTFINDSIKDLSQGYKKIEQIDKEWENAKNVWNYKKIDIVLNLDFRISEPHIWLNVPEEHRKQLHSIRAELGLGRPYFGLHMTIGYANDKNLSQMEYIHDSIKNGIIK
jgi:hypothetical protein